MAPIENVNTIDKHTCKSKIIKNMVFFCRRQMSIENAVSILIFDLRSSFIKSGVNLGVFVCLFDLVLYVHSTIFQLCGTVLPGFNQY